MENLPLIQLDSTIMHNSYVWCETLTSAPFLPHLQVGVGVGVAVSEVADISSVLEGVGPGQAVVVRLLPRVLTTERRLEVLDVVPRPPPPHSPLTSVSLRVEYGLHALVIEAACLWEEGKWGGGVRIARGCTDDAETTLSCLLHVPSQ